MKKIILLLFFIVFYNAGFAQVWTEVNNSFPPNSGGRDAASFSIGDTCYFIGGYSTDSWGYDTLTQTWISLASYPGPYANGAFVGFSFNGMGYVGTGVGGGYTWDSTMWQYNPATNLWAKVAHFPGQPRGYAVGFNIDGRLFLGCGIGNSTGTDPGEPLNDFYEYNPVTNTWTQILSYPGLGNQEDVSFVIGDKAYVGCGSTVNSSGVGITVDSDFYEYDTTSKVWTRIADIPSYPRYGAIGLGTCSKGYLGLGGDLSGTMFNDFWAYNPVNNKWTQLPNFGGNARYDASGFVIGKSFFVGLGVDQSGNTENNVWEFIPQYSPAFSADTSVCAGGSITFTDTSNYEPSGWSWQFPGGTPGTDTASNPTITYNSPGQYDVILTAWTSCGDTGTKTFTKYITVGNGSLLTILPASKTICSGQTVKLIVQDTGSFFWSPSTGLSATTGDSVVANPTATTVYLVTGTGSGGCVPTGVDTVIVNTPQPFYITPPSSQATTCPGQPITLSVDTSGRDYVWSPSTTLNVTTGDSVIASPLEQTTYTVTGLDSLGCTVTASDTVSVRKGINKPLITDTDNVLTTSATQGNQWYKNGSEINGATGIKYDLTDTGCYWDIATNIANGCSSISDTICVTTLAGIKQLAVNSNQISIFPNPTNGEIILNISSSVGEVKDWHLQITDVLGRTVYTKLSLDYNNDIDLSNLPGGVYFIAVINKAGRAVVPVVKQ